MTDTVRTSDAPGISLPPCKAALTLVLLISGDLYVRQSSACSISHGMSAASFGMLTLSALFRRLIFVVRIGVVKANVA